MSDASNEKAQFLMAAARILGWQGYTAVWTDADIKFVFKDDSSVPSTIPVDHDEALPGWDDLSPTEKLGAAQSALKAAASLVPAYDPTRPGWVSPTGSAA